LPLLALDSVSLAPLLANDPPPIDPAALISAAIIAGENDICSSFYISVHVTALVDWCSVNISIFVIAPDEFTFIEPKGKFVSPA